MSASKMERVSKALHSVTTNMDFFYRSLEAAQEQAKTLTISASNSAKGIAETLTEHTKSLAEQAGTVSSQAAEQASQTWKGINLQDSLPFRTLQRDGAANAGPSSEELLDYAITPDFKEFIRSLTYSTFRDFPLDQLPPMDKNCDDKVLTPWQEKHALLVVQEVKEINELRFVLCPKRMNDAQFWVVYFSLARKYMPPEAFDPGFQVPEGDKPAEPQRNLLELQRGIQKTFETARQTASKWRDRATNKMHAAEISAQLHDLVESHSRGGTPKASAAGTQAGGFGPPLDRDTPEMGLGAGEERDLDADLEAYLQTLDKEGKSSTRRDSGGNDNDGEEDEEESVADLEDYLNELKNGESEKDSHEEEEEEDTVDVGDLLQNSDQAVEKA